MRVKFEGLVPRTLFGQQYWGETSSRTMTRILELTNTMPWRHAIAAAAKGEPVEKHLSETVGPDVIHAFPWGQIETVLDIGAGMGFLSCQAARYAKTVVSLEAVPERAHFIKERSKQDGQSIYPIIANGLEPPFPDESFDLITLNGVFEYLGLWGEGDPEQMQRDFLKRALSLLKPGGYLYIGIENRYALAALLGGRDHSGLAFTSLMPRKVAHWYCRLRSFPIYGAEHITRDYRTYTYTPAQYETMVKSVGFGTCMVQGVFDGYNHQRALYDMSERGLRNEILKIVNPPWSLAGRISRWISDSKWLYRTLENEVVIFASKAPRQQPILWNGFSPGATIGQINTHSKMIAVCCKDGSIRSLAEAPKIPAAAKQMALAYHILSKAEEAVGESVLTWPLRWARPQGVQWYENRPFYHYEFVRGLSLTRLAVGPDANSEQVRLVICKVISEYPLLCRRLVEAMPKGDPDKPLRRVLDDLRRVCDDTALLSQMERALDRAHVRGWAMTLIHGDLSGNNIIVMPSGKLCLVDWEHVTEHCVPEVDLIRLYYDFVRDLSSRRSRKADELLSWFHRELRGALTQQGYDERDLVALETLFVGHQTALILAKEGTVNDLLAIHKSGNHSVAAAR
jgi:SAM-dependent methyltransferase